MPVFESIETATDARGGQFSQGTNVLQEKIDGANFKFARESVLSAEYHEDGREIVFGGRRMVFKHSEDESNGYADAMNCIRSTVSAADIKAVEDEFDAVGDFIFYGESLTPHTLEYDFESAPAFVGFSVYDTGTESYVPVSTARQIYRILDLPVPNQVTVERPLEEIDESFIPSSEYGECVAEGIVITNTETNARCKLVRDSFKEMQHEASTSDERDVIDKYMTSARVEKMVHKFVTRYDYDEPSMRMMAPTDDHDGLVAEVIADMMEEAGHKIIMDEDVEIDTAEIRSMASGKVSDVLQAMN